MRTSYKLTEFAEKDLREIFAYIAEKNPRAAVGQQEKFTKKFQFLCDFPHAGRIRPEFSHEYLSIIEGSYVIFYTETKYINIIRIIHSSRDLTENQLT